MPGMNFRIQASGGARRGLLLVVVMMVFATSLLLYANAPAETIYGNYTGAGTCPPGTPKPCADTAPLDNVFVERFDKPETDEQRQIREIFGFPKADSRVAIRIFRDYGHTCAFEGEMFQTGDHLEFKDEPPPRGVIPITCRLQLWEKNGGLELRDPGNECSEKFCYFGPPPRLDGMRFTKGPDQLLAASRKSAVPPPASIFGTYNGTGTCATDERKSEFCRENKVTDYLIVRRDDSGAARITLGSAKRPEDREDYLCLRDAHAIWLENRLVVVQESVDFPGSPDVVQFGFKGDSAVLNILRSEHCGSQYWGAVFERPSGQLGHGGKQ